MSNAYNLAPETTSPELDLWGVFPVQRSIIKDSQYEARPISSLNNSSAPITFEIKCGSNEYLQFRECELYMCIRINLAKVPVVGSSKPTQLEFDDWKQISPVNFLLHSLFKQVTVTIGNTTVTSSSRFYPYRAIFEGLLYHSAEAHKTTLSQALWHKDTAGSMNDFNQTRIKGFVPTDKKDLSKSQEVELMGKLHIDLAFQDRAIIGDTNINITLYPNDPKFYLMYADNLIPSVDFVDACIKVHKSIVSPAIVEAHSKALKISNAKYFVTRKDIKSFILHKGTLDGFINNVENGALPRRIAVACVSNEAFNGSNLLNPYFFKNYTIKQIVCYIDGESYPARGYLPDFGRNKFAREYFGLFEAFNQTGYTSTIDISPQEFKEGYTIFGFNFAPDLNEDCNSVGYISPIKHGNMRIEIKFGHALTETINVIVFCEYDSIIEIPETRVALKNFN